MKTHLKLIYSFFLCLNLYQCQSQNINSNKSNNMNLIDSSLEKLNIDNPKLLETKKTQGLVEPYLSRFDVDLTETLGDSSIQSTIGTIGLNYSQKTLLYKGWFDLYKEFYADGNIKLKKIQNKTSKENYGLMYEFNEQGKLIKTTNFDEGWKTSFESITEIAGKYAKKYNYKIETSMNSSINAVQQWDKEYVKIWRTEREGKKYWRIGFNKAHYENSDDKKCERVVVLIDDNSGKILKDEHYFDWYNRYFKEL